MRFTDVFIKRPVLAVSISFLIALLGLQAVFKMQVREYPEMTNTVVTVTTSYYGASADLIQGFITQPLEQAVAQADNIDYMTSQSVLGQSTITVNMKLNTDLMRRFQTYWLKPTLFVLSFLKKQKTQR